MPSRILWAIVGGFLVGVFVRSFMLLGLSVVALGLLLATTTLALAFLDRVRAQSLIIIAVALVALSGGIARMHSATLSGDVALTERVDTKVTLEGYVTAEPDVRDTGVRISMHVERLIFASSTIKVSAGVIALVPPHADIAYGDNVHAEGALRLPEAFDTSTGRQFHYPEYLAKDGIGYHLTFAQIERTEGSQGNVFKDVAIRVKQTYLRGQSSVLPEPEAGLAGGITVGDKRGVGKEYSDIFITVGLVHIIVLSGYNITVIMNLIGKLLTKMPRAIQFLSSAFVVVFIVLMTGGAPSATRAGAMAMLPLIARMTGRIYLALRALGVVALVMVFWNPFVLAFDPGFQLSVLATIGLVSFSPLFATWLEWIPEKFILREIVVSTLGTQLAVLPLLLYQNGQLSLVALPANLLALPPVPFAMLASSIASVGGMVFGSYAVPLALPAYILLAYIIGVAKFFATLPFASVSIPAFSAWWLLLLYGGLFLWAFLRTATSRKVD